MNDTPTAADLVALHAAAIATDKATAQDTNRETIEASLTAHERHMEACEAFRRKHYPRAGRVVAVFGEVFTVSPTARKITCIYSERADR